MTGEVVKQGVSSPQRPDRVGQVLLGKLRVLRHLGGGGMGDVYEVEHMLTHHRRALKIVRAELARQPRYVERLLREASIAGRLNTPYVAETLDAGRLEDGSAYVLMELLSGRSLHEVLELDPRLAQRRVANILSQVAEGMGVAHAAGIVHRDLKPENVFLVGDEQNDRVKILDFGISKIESTLTENATRLTREGTVIGTPFYMSPEQAAGRDVDARADIWAIGVIAYEALTGKVPFNGATVGEVMMLIGAGMYPPVRTRRPDVDPGFAAVIDRALRPDPRDRYESAEAMRRDLVQFATNEPAARAKTISDGPREERASGEPAMPIPKAPQLPREAREDREKDAPKPERASPSVSSSSISIAPASDAGLSVSSEAARASRRRSGIALALAVALALGLTIFVSTSRRGATEHASTPPPTASEPIVATRPEPPPATEALGEAPTPQPEPEAEIDAALAAPVPPPPSAARDARPPHTRTPAEAAGLESNPYGSPP